MKVVLTADVPKLGRQNEVKEVKPGFGRNYLLPRGLAKVATKNALAQAAALQATQASDAERQLVLKNQALAAISGQTFAVKRKANEQGHLFVGLSAATILKIIGKTAEELKPEWLTLEKPIKSIGDHKLTLNDGEEKISFTLSVSAS